MVIKERSKGDTSGTLVCPHCKKWLYLVAESFESITKERNLEANMWEGQIKISKHSAECKKKKKVYKKVLAKLFGKQNIQEK